MRATHRAINHLEEQFKSHMGDIVEIGETRNILLSKSLVISDQKVLHGQKRKKSGIKRIPQYKSMFP